MINLCQSRKTSISEDFELYFIPPNFHSHRMRYSTGRSHSHRMRYPTERSHTHSDLAKLIINNKKCFSIDWDKFYQNKEDLHNVLCSFEDQPSLIVLRSETKSKIENEVDIDIDITSLYKFHDDLTDKKLLGTITINEEKKLEEIRDRIEFYNENEFIEIYDDKINKYQELLKEIKELKQLLKESNE